MKTVLFAVLAAFSTAAFAQQDTAGCDLTTKPGYAICHMENCIVGDSTVASCVVGFKVRKGSAGQEVLPKCDAGMNNYPCENNVHVKPRRATTPEEEAAFQDAYQRQIDQYNNIGG